MQNQNFGPRPPRRGPASPGRAPQPGPRPPLTPEQRRRRAEARRRRQRQLRNRRIVVLAVALVLLALAAWGITRLLQQDKPGPGGPAPGASSSTGAGSAPANGGSSAAGGADSPAPGPAQGMALTGDDEWLLRLVNHTHPLPEGFSVETEALPNGKEFDARAIGQLKQMLADGNATGLQLMVCSAYRSVARQDELFEEMKRDYMAQGMSEQEAYDKTATIRTPHGCSEHSSGLAADIVAVDYQMLDDGFAETPEAQWLLAHAAEYGFILRYPKEKEEITGIIWEPWHFRYVGVENAKKIEASGLCLEEYLGAA